MVEIQNFGRPRQYVSAARLYAMFPLLRFSYERGAYVLRIVGETRGPVLRKDRRRQQQGFTGYDRRAGGVDLFESSRPLGSVRRIEVAAAPRRRVEGAEAAALATDAKDATDATDATRRRANAAEANRRRRQHGRQRPPRPHR